MNASFCSACVSLFFTGRARFRPARVGFFFGLPGRLGECLVDVGNQIVNVFDADRQPNHIGTDARRFQLFIV